MSDAVSSSPPSVLVLGCVTIAVFVAAASHVSLCTVQYQCLNSGDCILASSSLSALSTCSFQNSVSVTSFDLTNMSSTASFSSMTRGVCSPGEVQSRNADGFLNCIREASFPNAFSSSAADPSAIPFHMQSAGKWISSKRGEEVSFGFFDADQIAKLVENDIIYGFNPSLAHTDFDRFRASCEAALTNGAMSFDASTAYEFLKSELAGLDVLKSLGKLSSYLCDTPINFASDLNGNGWKVNAVDGNIFSPEAIDAALYSFSEGFFVRQRARAFAETALSAPLSELSVVESVHVNAAFEASVIGSNIDDAVVIGSYTVQFSQNLISFARFLHALHIHGAVDAKAYLRGVNAMCISALRSATTGVSGLEAPVSDALEAIRKKSKFKAVAMGKFEFDLFHEPTIAHITESLSMRPSSLFAFAGVETSRNRCFNSARMIFPDHFDRLVFDRLVGVSLNTRITTLVAEIKSTIESEFLSGRTRFLIAAESDRLRIASLASSAVVTVVGNGHRSGDRLSLVSTDGPLTIAVKQSRALFLKTMELALDFKSVCDLPSLMLATTRNAYILTMSNCIFLLPGILLPPFASLQYNDASLRSRIGFVVAHELSHIATFNPNREWDWGFAEELMQNYTTTTYTEAAADLVAVSSMRDLVSKDELCLNIGQIWASSPEGYSLDDRGVHPVFNLRGDNLCVFLNS